MELPEIISIGIYHSRKMVRNTKTSKKRTTAMFEIEIPIEKGGISYIDENVMAITPEMIICAKPGQVRHTKFPFKCYYIHMNVKKGLIYDTLMNMPDFLPTENHAYYKDIFVKLCKYNDSANPHSEIIIQSLILELIYSINREARKQVAYADTKQTNHLMLEKVLKYIKENLSHELTLETVAEVAHLSPIHFHNCFKVAVGKTLRDYVEEQRIKKAIHLLVSTDYSLTEIALECGFSSQSYFSYVFKRRMHTTPRNYMRNMYNQYEVKQ